MVITPETVQDWQSIDSRVAENVRKVEHRILEEVFGVRADFWRAFMGEISPGQLAEEVTQQIETRAHTVEPLTVQERARIRGLLGGDFQEIIHREQIRPAGDELEQRQRITRELAAAVRRSVPPHLIDRLNRELLPETWTQAGLMMNGVPSTITIDLTHEFWHNRIQSTDELRDAIAGRAPSAIGMSIQPPVPATFRLNIPEAAAIVASRGGGTGSLGIRLQRERVRTLVSDDKVSSTNVATVMHLAQQHASVRRALMPDLAKTRRELDEAQQERGIVSALGGIRSLQGEFSNVNLSWPDVRANVIAMQGDVAAVTVLTPGNVHTCSPASGGMVVDFSGMTTPREVAPLRSSALQELQKRLADLQKQNQIYENLAARIRSITETVQAVRGRKGAAVTHAETMVPFAGAPPAYGEFTLVNTPDVVANDIVSKLTLDTTEGAYDKKVKEKADELRDLEEGKKLKTGKEAVLEAYRAYFQELRGKGWLLTEEAARTLYRRNNLGYEEEKAREEAQEETIGREQRPMEATTNSIHNFLHGRPEVIVAAIAEAEGIGAPTSGTRQLGFLWRKHRNQPHLGFHMGQIDIGLYPTESPKWSALNNPKLLTAYYALRKLRQDENHDMNLRNTGYYRKQMDEISELLIRRLGEKSERDLAKEIEVPQEELERKAMGEPDKEHRGIRLLLSGDILASYSGRVDKVIGEANGRVRFVKRNVAKAARATGRATVSQGKREWGAVKNVAKGFVGKSTNNFFNYTVGLPYQVAVRAPVAGVKKLFGGLRRFHAWGRSAG